MVVVVDQTGAVVSGRQRDGDQHRDRRHPRRRCPARTGSATVLGALADRRLHRARHQAGLHRRGRRRASPCARARPRRSRVTLVASGGKTDVAVYGTEPGRPRGRADRPPPRQRRRSTRRRSSAARSRRSRSSTPPSGRARARATSSSTQPTSSPPPAAAARRRSCSTARATTRAGAARRCSPPCRLAPSRKSRVLCERVLVRVRLDRRAPR